MGATDFKYFETHRGPVYCPRCMRRLTVVPLDTGKIHIQCVMCDFDAAISPGESIDLPAAPASRHNGNGANARGIMDQRAPPKKQRRHRGHPYQGLIDARDFMKRLRPPDYLCDGLLLRGSTYTLTGNTGHCKTLIALLLSIRIARGEWFCGRKCEKGTVAFYAGENPDNVRIQFFAVCADLGINPKEQDIVWHEGVFAIGDAMRAAKSDLARFPDLSCCVFDSLQAFTIADDDNSNMAMLDMAMDFRQLTAGHANRPVCIVLAHPVKNASKDNLLPRGGSAVTNEFDGNLTSWLDIGTNIAELHWQGKFRGMPFDPIKLEQVLVKPEALIDARGDQMACMIIRPLGEEREAEIHQDSEDAEMRILAALKANPGASQRKLIPLTGISRTTIQRHLKDLKAAKWIKAYKSKNTITSEGEKALELAEKGG